MRNTYTKDELRELKIRRNKIRRARQLRRRVSVAIASFIIVLFISFGMTSFLSSAHELDEEPVKMKYYTSIEIPVGTTLSDIASEYIDYDYYKTSNDYIKEVMFINHLTDDQIKSGYHLIVPYYAEL